MLKVLLGILFRGGINIYQILLFDNKVRNQVRFFGYHHYQLKTNLVKDQLKKNLVMDQLKKKDHNRLVPNHVLQVNIDNHYLAHSTQVLLLILVG